MNPDNPSENEGYETPHAPTRQDRPADPDALARCTLRPSQAVTVPFSGRFRRGGDSTGAILFLQGLLSVGRALADGWRRRRRR